MEQNKIRNVAIIAHVDHGKTTLVDQLFKQSGMFRDNQAVTERMMDSMDLERERGITITAKNGSYQFKDYWINIIDTPGHADFGGQVERVLRMADGALLLVDAQEGPMPQTYFVLKKALQNNLPVIVVINKIDKPAARCNWVVNQVFDLFAKLDAPDDILDFPVVYASAKNGYSLLNPEDPIDLTAGMAHISQMIVDHTPAPSGSSDASLQMQVGTIDYSPYLGRLGIGKVVNGTMRLNQPIVVARRDGSISPVRISKIFRFECDAKVAIESAGVGEIVAVAGMEDVTVGVTFTDPDNPRPLPLISIDPPTIFHEFYPQRFALCRQGRQICYLPSYRRSPAARSSRRRGPALRTADRCGGFQGFRTRRVASFHSHRKNAPGRLRISSDQTAGHHEGRGW
jgi:GTP-binding protein